MLRLLAALAVAVLLAARALAAPYTAHFAPLQAALNARLADGTLDAKQTKAAQKILALLDQPSADLKGDVKLLGKVVAKLKPFGADAPIMALRDALTAALVTDVGDQIAGLESTVDGLAAGTCQDKADGVATKASAALQKAQATLRPTPALLKALALVTKGTKKASSCTPGGGGGGGGGGTCDGTNVLTVAIDGAPFTPEAAVFYRGDDVQSVTVFGSANVPAYSELSLTAWNVPGPGTFPIQEFSSWVENGAITFQPPSTYTVTGTLTVTKLVAGTPGCVAGSFDVTFTAGATTRHVTGTYDLSQSF